MPRLGERMEDHISSWLKHLHEPEKAERKQKHRPFVTISRESGAYGTTIADALVEHLNRHERRGDIAWAALDKELVQKVIEDHKLPASFEAYFAQSSASRIQDILEDFFGVHPPREMLVHKMSETVLRLASIGHVVLIGQGAGIITRELQGGTHVRLIGSLEKRIAHMVEWLRLPEKQAREHVLKEDRGRREHIKRYFKMDVTDASLYDIVINTDKVALHDAVAIIGASIAARRGDGER
jgi:cytidylate kinase